MEQNKVILLVEDDRHDELLTLRAFEKNKIRSDVVVCRDGAEALDWLFQRGMHEARPSHVVPHVVLLDLQLPKVSGHEVLAAIRHSEQFRRLPVVILTTSKEQSDVGKCYDTGANSYVQKPVNFDEFSLAVKNLGLYWLLLNEPPALAEAAVEV